MSSRGYYRGGRGGYQQRSRNTLELQDRGGGSEFIRKDELLEFVRIKRAMEQQQFANAYGGGGRYMSRSPRGRGAKRKFGGRFQQQNFRQQQQRGKRGSSRGKRGRGNISGKSRPFLRFKPKPPRKERSKKKFLCIFCKHESKTAQEHAEHIKDENHKVKVTERMEQLRVLKQEAHDKCRVQVENAKRQGRRIKFCLQCYQQYYGATHQLGKAHKDMVYTMSVYCPECQESFPSRFQYEKHMYTFAHLRNVRYKLIEAGKIKETFDCPEEYNEEVIGSEFIVDVKGRYCKICDLIFAKPPVSQHCKSQTHHDNLKKYIEQRKTSKEIVKTEDEEMETDNVEQKELPAVGSDTGDDITAKTEEKAIVDDKAEDEEETEEKEIEEETKEKGIEVEEKSEGKSKSEEAIEEEKVKTEETESRKDKGEEKSKVEGKKVVETTKTTKQAVKTTPKSTAAGRKPAGQKTK